MSNKNNIINSNFNQIANADANGVLTTLNTTSLSNVTLGNVSNLHITGGSNGQSITTDGAGNLSWGTPVAARSIVNGNTSVVADANSTVHFNVSGNADVVQVTSTGLVVGANYSANLGLVENLSLQTLVSNNPVNASPGQTLAATSDGGWQFVDVLHYQVGVRVATTVSLTVTYDNGDSGVGATLTNSASNVALTIDTVAVIVGDRVMVKNQTNEAHNGIYVVTTAGDGSTAWVLTRTTDYDTPYEILGKDIFYVSAGAVNAGQNYIQLNAVTTVGTSPFVFQGAGAATLQSVTTAGNSTTVDTTFHGNFYADGANVSLGSVANVFISGGSNGQVMTTDGAGNLSFASNLTTNARVLVGNAVTMNSTVATTTILAIGDYQFNLQADGGGVVSQILPAGSKIVFQTDENVYTITSYTSETGNAAVALITPNIAESVPSGTYVNTNSYTSTSRIVNGGNINIDVTGQVATISTSARPTQIYNGNSNVTVDANASIRVGAAGIANVVDISGTQVTLTKTLVSNAEINFTGSTNVSLGNVANVYIAGGSNNQILTTNGTGNLSFSNKTINLVDFTTNTQAYVSGDTSYGVSNISVVGQAGSNLANTFPVNTFFRVGSGTNTAATYRVTAVNNTPNPATGTLSISPVLAGNIANGVYLWEENNSPIKGVTFSNNFSYQLTPEAQYLDVSFNGNIGYVEEMVLTSLANGNATPGQTLVSLGNGNWGFESVVHYQAGVVAATTANLNATYDNGAAGFGATLTNAGANAALAIDTVNLVEGDRVLVKDQTNEAYNGIYGVTTVGDGSTAWVLTRATDYDTPQDMLGQDVFYVSEGATNINASFIQLNYIASVGVTPVVFQSSGVATLQSVTTAGNTTNVNVTFGGTLTSNATVDFSPASNVNLGNISNLHISGGGANNYFITTDGNGNLSWVVPIASGGNVATVPFTHFDVEANGNNQTFISNSITYYSSNTTMSVYHNGVLVNPVNYQISGNVLTINLPLAYGDNIDIPPLAVNASSAVTVANIGGVNTNVQFNDAGVFAGSNGFNYNKTNNTVTAFNVTTTRNLTVNSGNSSSLANVDFTSNVAEVRLGAVGNVKITGGSNLQFLRTDGAGNLSWATVSTSAISNGTSNVSVPFANGNVNISSAGNANVLIVTGTGANIDGTANITGNLFAGNFTTRSITANANINFVDTSNVSLGAVGNLHITGGSNLQFLRTDGAGNLAWASVDTSFIANGNSNVSIAAANGNVTFGVAGNANIITVTGTGANIPGNLTIGNITTAADSKLFINSSIESSTSNGGLVVTSNISNANLVTTLGNGNIFTGGNITQGTLTSTAAATAVSHFIYSTTTPTTAAGALVISSNTANPNVTTTVGVGNIRTGNTLTVGTGLNNDTNAAVTASRINLHSTVNATDSRTGALTVTGNIANAQLSTSIGNGNIWTGGMLILGNVSDSANLTYLSTRNTTGPGGSSTGYSLWYGGNSVQEFRMGSNAVNPTFTFGTLTTSGFVAVGNVGFALQGSNVGNATITVVANEANANLILSAKGSGNVIVPTGNLRVTRGANVTVSTDEYIVMGGNNAGAVGSPVVFGIQTSNTTYGGFRWSKAAGTEVAFMGLDNTGNVGNFRINTNTVTPFFIQSGNSSRGDYNTVSETKGYAVYYANQVSVNDFTDTRITSYNLSGTDTTGLSLSSGTWTNTSGRTLYILIQVQSTWQTNSTGARIHWIQPSNGGSTITTRWGMTDTAATSGEACIVGTSQVMAIANGGTFEVWTYQTSGTALIYGGSYGGQPANTSSRVTITVL